MKATVKTFAVLDRCTSMQLVVSEFETETDHEARIFHRHGFGIQPKGRYLFFYSPNLEGCEGNGTYDTYRLADQYTLGTAARYAEEHWSELESGDVLDAECIRGEKDAPKTFDDEYDWKRFF